MSEKDLQLLDFCEVGGIKDILYRKETSDLNCLKEVIEKKTYQHKKYGFLLDKNDKWIDLGGNIGAFGLFANDKVESVVSFEPDVDCFEIMSENYKQYLNLHCFNFAISSSQSEVLSFFKSQSDKDRYRTSVLPNKRGCKIELRNKHFSFLEQFDFNCLKIDIEGCEFELFDKKLIPKNLNKLVFEYHITKDKSLKNFHERIDYLRTIFDEVQYMKSLDKFDKDSQFPGFFDRLIFCKNL
jgi:FkbM family methyltransferase